MAALRRDPSAPIPTSEVFGPIMNPERDLFVPKISYGLPFDGAILNHVASDARVYVIASKSLSEKTDSLQRLQASLGNRIVGVRIGMTSHTLFHECVEVTAAARQAKANTVISLGAGSLSDAAKFVCQALANNLETIEQLDKFNLRIVDGEYIRHKGNPAEAKLICIPTSLSAGEHTDGAGITDAATRKKYQIPTPQASVTILDPWLALHTPLSIWMQSGVRGIDHCVEHLLSPKAHSDIDAACLGGLKLLVPALFGALHDTRGVDARARLNAQLGVALSVIGVVWRVPGGASHGIGHMLGPMGVGHGETSCILLPAVCKYNSPVTRPRQHLIQDTLWEIPECREVFKVRGLKSDQADLGDLLDAVIRALGMPRSLKEKGIVGDRVEQLAEMSLHDPFLYTNPIPITTKDQVLEILNQVRG